MEIANKPVYINIARPSVYAVLHAKQSDVNRAFTAVFNNDGEAWAIPENAVVSIWYRGAAGEGNYTKGIEINGNTAVVPLVPQMLSVPGTGLLCIIINTAAGDQIGTWNIPYFVEEVPGSNSEAATEFYTAFSETASEVAASAIKASEYANEAAAAADAAQKAAEEALAKSWALADGKAISENTDLHTITEIGNYYCYMTTTAKTLVNCPVATAFTLKIYCATGTGYKNGVNQHQYIRADLRSLLSERGYAYYADAFTTDFGATWTWSDWHKVASQEDVEAAANGKVSKSGDTMTGHLEFPVTKHLLFRHTDKSLFSIATASDNTVRITKRDENNAFVSNYFLLNSDGTVQYGGGNMIGALTLKGDPTENLHATTKQYVDAKTDAAQATADAAMPKAGGEMTGWIAFENRSVGFSWAMDDGTIFSLRPYTPTGEWQIVITDTSGNVSAPFTINSSGRISLSGETAVYNTKIAGDAVRNISVKNASATADVSTASIYFTRK